MKFSRLSISTDTAANMLPTNRPGTVEGSPRELRCAETPATRTDDADTSPLRGESLVTNSSTELHAGHAGVWSPAFSSGHQTVVVGLDDLSIAGTSTQGRTTWSAPQSADRRTDTAHCGPPDRVGVFIGLTRCVPAIRVRLAGVGRRGLQLDHHQTTRRSDRSREGRSCRSIRSTGEHATRAQRTARAFPAAAPRRQAQQQSTGERTAPPAEPRARLSRLFSYATTIMATRSGDGGTDSNTPPPPVPPTEIIDMHCTTSRLMTVSAPASTGRSRMSTPPSAPRNIEIVSAAASLSSSIQTAQDGDQE